MNKTIYAGLLAASTLSSLLAASVQRPLPIVFEPGVSSAFPFSARAGGQVFTFDASGGFRAILPSASPGRGPASFALTLSGAYVQPEARLRDPLPGRSHYLVGDPARWRTDVAQYGSLAFANVYPGIDLLYRGGAGRLEYDFHVAPGADPHAIRLAFQGIDDLRIDKDGDLLLTAGEVEWRHHRCRIYQEAGGARRPVPGSYVRDSDRTVRFEVGEYDKALPLVIDPEVSYFRYAGGAGDDRGYGIAVDASGSVYIAGETWSVLSSSTGAFQRSPRGGSDTFLVKLSADGSQVVYCTYLGGSARDSARGLGVDAAGNAYVTGFTYSRDFPATAAAYQRSSVAYPAAFAVKLNAAGSALIYSTFFGGSGSDYSTAIAVNSFGEAYLAGYTNSWDFPTTASAGQRNYGAGFYDGFVVKLNAAGSGVQFASYVGGSGNDTIAALAIDVEGNAYVAGQTDSSNFPRRNALYQVTAGTDAFVSKVNTAGQLVYSTTLGGHGVDTASAVAVDAAGAVYMAGSTGSTDFPATAGALQAVTHGNYDAFAAKLSSSGQQLVFATYLGGAGSEEIGGIAVDGSGRLYMAGWTNSPDFPGQAAAARDADAVFAVLSAAGDKIENSMLLGGSGAERALALAVDSSGAAYLTGFTASGTMPGIAGMYGAFSGSLDAFIAKIGSSRAPEALSVSPASGSGSHQTFSFVFSDGNGYADIAGVIVIINSVLNGYSACSLSYYRGVNAVFLTADNSPSSTRVGFGLAETAQNSQCSISGIGTQATGSGNNLTLTVTIDFKPGFGGPKNIYMFAQDTAGLNSGVPVRGTWTVPGAASPPSAVSVVPSSGSGSAQTFTVTFSHPAGNAEISGVSIIFNTGLDGFNACYIMYPRDTNYLYLFDDARRAFIGVAPGSSGAVENNQCVLSASGSSVAANGNNLVLTLSLRFKAGFAGTKNIYLYAEDRKGLNSGAPIMGTWLASVGQPPVAVSVTPSAGSGSSQVFRFQFSDANGYADISGALVIINSGLNGNYACSVMYFGGDTVYLAGDSSGLTAVKLGTTQTAANSQCSIAGVGSSVSAGGSDLVLNVAVTFKPAFSGLKNIYLYAEDTSGMNSGAPSRGTWTVR